MATAPPAEVAQRPLSPVFNPPLARPRRSVARGGTTLASNFATACGKNDMLAITSQNSFAMAKQQTHNLCRKAQKYCYKNLDVDTCRSKIVRATNYDYRKSKIFSRIKRPGKGSAFVAKDFMDIANRGSVDVAPSGLVKAGTIRRNLSSQECRQSQ